MFTSYEVNLTSFVLAYVLSRTAPYGTSSTSRRAEQEIVSWP